MNTCVICGASLVRPDGTNLWHCPNCDEVDVRNKEKENIFKRFVGLTRKHIFHKTTGKRHPITREQLIERFERSLLDGRNGYSKKQITDLVAEFKRWLARRDGDGVLPPKAQLAPKPAPKKKKPRKPSSGGPEKD